MRTSGDEASRQACSKTRGSNRPTTSTRGPLTTMLQTSWSRSGSSTAFRYPSTVAGLQLAVEKREVRREVLLADVLGEPDGADRVEAGLRHVAVIQVPYFGEPGQPFPLDRGLRPRGLLGGQRDPESLDAVLTGGVH